MSRCVISEVCPGAPVPGAGCGGVAHGAGGAESLERRSPPSHRTAKEGVPVSRPLTWVVMTTVEKINPLDGQFNNTLRVQHTDMFLTQNETRKYTF